jgi:microsomal dipeptidase-like Zn-dependent dipeptidase
MDNAFGGAALYDALFEMANLLVNGRFYDITTQCTPGLQWRSDLREIIASVKDGVNIAVGTIIALTVTGPLLLPIVAPLIPVLTGAMTPLLATLPALSLYVSILGPALIASQPTLAPLATVLGTVAALAPLILPVAAVPAMVGLTALINQAPGPVGEAPEPNCNSRGLQPLGVTLVNELIDHHMMIDVDHTDSRTLEGIMQIAEQKNYPGIVSGHTGLLGGAMTEVEAVPILLARGETYDAGKTGRHEGTKTDAMVQRIVNLGGVVSLALAQGGRSKIRDYDPNDNVPFNCGGSSQTFAQVYLYATKGLGLQAVSFGSDLNGFSTWPVPRYGARACGNRAGHFGDFGPGYIPATGQLDYTDLKDYSGEPLDRYQFGARTWDYNTDGLAHVGLYPDFIADLEAIGLTHDELAPLFNSVEAYVRMWEKIDDDQAPTVRCGSVGEDWHADDVSVPCIAFDFGWGLATAGDASFSLSTSVPAGAETGDATTATHAAICDSAGHCSSPVAAIAGINVDKKNPTIALIAPAAGTPTFTVGQVVLADYSCADGGSGVATCAGPIASGVALDTAVGVHQFTVNATDRLGHAAAVSHPYNVAFAICPLYDPTVTKKAGSTVPIKVRLCDVSGANLSSPSVVVHATGVTLTSNNTPAALEDSGNANPDFDFRYDASLGGYIFNLSTRGLGAGTYMLNFVAGSDPTTHTASFAVR